MNFYFYFYYLFFFKKFILIFIFLKFCMTLPQSSNIHSSLTSHLLPSSLSSTLLIDSKFKQIDIITLLDHINNVLSIYHQASIQPYYTLSPAYTLTSTLSASTSYLSIFATHINFQIQKLLNSLSWKIYLEFIFYIGIFYGLLFLVYSLRLQYVSVVYITLLYSGYILYTTLLITLIFIPHLVLTYQQHLSIPSSLPVNSTSLHNFTSLITYHLSTVTSFVFLTILLIIFLFSLMMYPLSLETHISTWLFYCGFMISILYCILIVSCIWFVVVLTQGNINLVSISSYFFLFFFSSFFFFLNLLLNRFIE